MAKVKQIRLHKEKLGKYSKVMGYSEEMLDEVIEVKPEKECVKDDIKTAALEVMDVVDIPKKDGSSEEVVVVETPDPEDTTIKVQSTDTGVTADVPVEVFSKARKISKAKLKAYSESEKEAEEAKAEEEEKPAEETPAEEKAEEKEEKAELETNSEETPAEAAAETAVEAKQEAEEQKAEAAAEVAENAAEVKQPENTDKLPIVVEKVDNGYNVTANGETKVASDVKGVCDILAELFEETKMDTFSKVQRGFSKFLILK